MGAVVSGGEVSGVDVSRVVLRAAANSVSTSIVCEANTVDGTMSWDERRGFVRDDRRQIQTAVLGGADSEEPLLLPLEAIELDAFRRRHEHEQ
ncbi:hypothetical protein [Streptomyces hokutonensis]|uniref:hypothetical protein n=1 Tax=Streptomyces hokutonensis TaxID=1306990 RepID=UPI0036787CBF